MKKIFFILLMIFSCGAFAQDMTKFKLYKPEENATEAIENAVKIAKKTNKHVFIQIGGNWCVWCARFEDFVKDSKVIDSLVKADFIVYHLNYSKENNNAEILKKYGFPQRFGFPVFLILNGDGDLIHTQNSAYLESGKSYDYQKVVEFFRHWGRSAFDPTHYKEL
jgi:thioredoxin-related protein